MNAVDGCRTAFAVIGRIRSGSEAAKPAPGCGLTTRQPARDVVRSPSACPRHGPWSCRGLAARAWICVTRAVAETERSVQEVEG